MSRLPQSVRRRFDTGARADVIVALVVFLGTVLFLRMLPLDAGGADEGYFVYESRMLLDGKILYRDMFEIITPLAHYAMAAVFAVFGTTMATARATFAVVHAMIGVLMFSICRLLGVRRTIAGVAGLAHVAVFAPAWPYASPHWVSSAVALVLVFALLRRPHDGFLAGMLVGLLIGCQQQRAAGFAVAAALCLAIADGAPGTIRVLTRFLGGVLAVVLPLALWLVLTAGVGPVVKALLVVPLVKYPGVNRIGWGDPPPLPELMAFTFTRVLRVLPVLAVITAIRAAASRGGRRRLLATLVVMAAGAVGSIAYHPDVIHIAYVGPIFAIVAAESIESLLRWLAAPALFGWVVSALAVAGIVILLDRRVAYTRSLYPVRRDTRFGTVAFRSEADAAIVDGVRALVSGSGPREIFVYPGYATLYLMTGTTNPTAYQLLVPGYSGPEQLADAISTLERRRVPCTVVLRPFMRADDPVAAYIERNYRHVPTPGEQDTLFAIYQRAPRD